MFLKYFVTVSLILQGAPQQEGVQELTTEEQAKLATSPIPQGMDTWIRFEDYPESAVKGLKMGRVFVQLKVGSNGQVKKCSIDRSSGFKDLDRATCDLLTERGRFRPAQNAFGEPVEGNYSTSVNWRLPKQEAGGLLPATDPARWMKVVDWPEHAWLYKMDEVTTKLHVAQDGTVDECVIEDSSGWPTVDESVCKALKMRARFKAVTDIPEDDPRRWIRWTMRPSKD